MSKYKRVWLKTIVESHDVFDTSVSNVRPTNESDWNDFSSCIEVIEVAALDRAVELLKSNKAAMQYAYEDRVDQYYLNVKNQIEAFLKELGHE